MLIDTKKPTTIIIFLIRRRPFLLNMFIVYLLYTMEDFRTRQYKRHFTSKPIFFIFLLIILFFLVRSTYISFYKRDKASEEHARFQKEYEELKARYDQLQADIDYLETERGAEQELRQRYDVVKEGEILIKIIEEEE